MTLHRYLWAIAFVFALAFSTAAQAQTALSGQVSSMEDGLMEGVLVNVKREGTTITTTVVTDGKGRFAFPADRIQSGKYSITVRAVGYILAGPKSGEVPASGTATADLTLNRARN